MRSIPQPQGSYPFAFAPLILLFALLVSSCTSTPVSTEDKTVSLAETNLEGTPLGQMAAALTRGQQDKQSGFIVLDRGHDALAWRLFMADQATRTIDAQYFLWKNDRLGRLSLQRLLDAAERGVRVRLLIDDSMTESDPLYLAKASAHPNLEVRLYKPFGPKHKSYVLRWVDFAADFKRLNRRMHNKLYIADNSLLISGGRNIGEDYFEYLAPDVFRSRDLLAAGPVAAESGASFDLYWNSKWAVPVEDAVDHLPKPEEATAFREILDREGKIPENYPPGYVEIADIASAQTRLETELMWGNARLVYDTVPGEDGQPDVPKVQTNQVGQALRKASDEASKEILIESAYLILTDATLKHIKKARDRGLEVTALTNSLAGNNHISAFVGYRKQRKLIIDTISRLYEYRPDSASQTAVYGELAPGQPVPHFGLHAKTAVFDRNTVFVGSFNLDPRSENLNTEVGLLVESPELGAAVAASILNDTDPGNAWQVRLNTKGKTEWVTTRDGKEIIENDNEPLTPASRKIKADIAQPLTPQTEM